MAGHGGKRKGAGRKKGVPLKNKQALVEKLQEIPGYIDPTVYMAQLVANPETDKTLRFQAAKELAQYIVPKLKTVENIHTGEVDHRLEIIKEVITGGAK